MSKTFILEVPAGTKVEIREYDNCHTITMYEQPDPIFVHDLVLQKESADSDLVQEELING